MDFEKAFDYVIGNEGSYDNDPTDRGGETRWGITHGVAENHRCLQHPLGIDIDDVTKPVAMHIYRTDYWRFDSIINDSIAVKLFDFGVNFGVHTSVKLAQEAANKLGASLKADGIIGRVTADAINALDPEKFLDAFETNADDRYASIVLDDFITAYGSAALKKRQLKYLKGWLRRSNRRYYG
jgi:lysozyme family protein